MKQLVTPNPLDEVTEALHLTEALDIATETLNLEEIQPVRLLPSYHPTPWTLVNRTLDIVDGLTGGRAAWVQRLFTYLFIGGAAAVVNLAVFYFVLYALPLPVDKFTHNLIASLLASEISIMANFIPNDIITFRHLPGRDRTWLARCVRFHITSVGGAILTVLIQFGFSFLGHVPAMISQVAALFLVLIYNFSFHHIFTYRHVKHKVA